MEIIVVGIILIVLSGILTSKAVNREAPDLVNLYTQNLIDRETYEQGLLERKAVPKYISKLNLLGYALLVFGIVALFI